jgi:inositol oxygenase
MSAPAQAPGFRNYGEETRATVHELYRLNHRHQTFDFVRAKKREYLSLDRKRLTVLEALELVETLVDDSDPDIDMGQIEHALQTAEAIRADGHPRWFVVTGLIHDLGKVLCSFGEPQWAVVGDSFPVGCAFRPSIVLHEFFEENPDLQVPAYSTRLGIYEEGCGLDRVEMSWGHDEYLYHVVKDRLPPEALSMIRYHSFYAAHREGDYRFLMSERDREMFEWVRAFNPYDLYSKSPVRPDRKALEPYYRELVSEFFPEPLRF